MTVTPPGRNATTAYATGSLTFTDVAGDVITGSFSGEWTEGLHGADTAFTGYFNSGLLFKPQPSDTQFKGMTYRLTGPTSVDMTSWSNTVVRKLTIDLGTSSWFTGDFHTDNIGAVQITAVPVPQAVLLGFLGLSVAGVGLRKFV
jgi:hypothetical protein